MIDINNKKFNFYDPVTIVDNDKEDQIFSETLYILSEKYIPSRENKMIMGVNRYRLSIENIACKAV